MRQLQYLNMYHHVQEKFQFHTAWLYDASETWGLGIRMAREESIELAFLKQGDTPSAFDALGAHMLPFLQQLLAATNTQVHQVELRTLPQTPTAWYGAITMTNGERTFELTTRTGLLIALALRTPTPLVIADDLLEKRGVRLPSSLSLPTWLAQPEQARLYEPIAHRDIPHATSVEPSPKTTPQSPFPPLNEEQRNRMREELQKHLTPQEQEKLKERWRSQPDQLQRNIDMWKQLGFEGRSLPEELLDE